MKQTCMDVLETAMTENGVPEIINSDQGSQFTSDEYIEYIKSLKKTEIPMDGKGRATDNAHIERFFRTIKYDMLYLNPSNDRAHLYQQCSEFIEYYNQRRGHSSHKYETPNDVYQQVA
jgi:putative transposase